MYAWNKRTRCVLVDSTNDRMMVEDEAWWHFTGTLVLIKGTRYRNVQVPSLVTVSHRYR